MTFLRRTLDTIAHDMTMKQDLTRLESGNETSFNEPFDLHEAITEAVQLYRYESTFFLLNDHSNNIWLDMKLIDEI